LGSAERIESFELPSQLSGIRGGPLLRQLLARFIRDASQCGQALEGRLRCREVVARGRRRL
jgi:hypothetical protein